jgi:hemerythrin-like domain-containing protein
MKIIDKETGKRVGGKDSEVTDHKKKLKDEDPIIRTVEKSDDSSELSAMDPPSAYDNERIVGKVEGEMDTFLNDLILEHKEVTEETNLFDAALSKFRDSGFAFTREIDNAFNRFFTYFDDHILTHNRKEEKVFFQLLHKRLIESGEHGTGEEPSTAIDLMEDDHVKFIQLAALSFNLLGLGTRLRDLESRTITYDLAFNTGRELVELLRLHIFREDQTLFPLAQTLLSEEDFLQINEA